MLKLPLIKVEETRYKKQFLRLFIGFNILHFFIIFFLFCFNDINCFFIREKTIMYVDIVLTII